MFCGEKYVNPLDLASRDHNITYLKNKYLKYRAQADKTLENLFWERVFLGNNSKVKVTSYAVMKAKQKISMGLKKNNDEIEKKNTKKKSTNNNKRIILCPSQAGVLLPMPMLLGSFRQFSFRCLFCT